jgi:hypothetical protein
MPCEDDEGHHRFLQQGDSSVLSEEAKADLYFIEAHPIYHNMADNDAVGDEEQAQEQEESPQQDADSDAEAEEDDDEEALDDDERERQLDEAETARLETIALAKGCVDLKTKDHKRKRTNISKIWTEYFFVPQLRDPNLEADLKKFDSQAYDMIVENKRPNVFIYCCMLAVTQHKELVLK